MTKDNIHFGECSTCAQKNVHLVVAEFSDVCMHSVWDSLRLIGLSNAVLLWHHVYSDISVSSAQVEPMT